MARVGDLDDDRFYHRQVEAGRDPIVEIAGIVEMPVFAVVVLLVEGPADALGRTALHLALDIGRVNGATGVLDDGEAQDLDLARLGVDLDIGDIGGD